MIQINNPQFTPTTAQYETAFSIYRTWLVQHGISTSDRVAGIKVPSPGQRPSWFGMIIATRLIAIGCNPAPVENITALHRYLACAAWNAEFDMDRGMSSREVTTDALVDPCEQFIAALFADWFARNVGQGNTLNEAAIRADERARVLAAVRAAVEGVR